MRGFNKVIIAGNVARDPDCKHTAEGRIITTLIVAANRAWKEPTGELHEEVDFIPIVSWGALAESCHKNFHKGDGVLIEGRVSARSFETKAGEKRNIIEIVASGIQFASGQKYQPQSPTTTTYQTQTRTYQNKNNRLTPQELEDAGASVGDYGFPY